MAKIKQRDPFWTSYSDLMTSLFFVMLVLFIICLIRVGHDKVEVQATNERLDSLLHEANADKKQLEQIFQLDEQFKVLSQSSSLGYDDKKKMFYAKDFVGIEIFYSEQDRIKDQYLETVDKVGDDLEEILRALSNDMFHYQLVIEGNAAIRWDKLKANSYDPDDEAMYQLSYRRALALYKRWKKHDFRKYNTEIIIAGSGFNGNNRDTEVEENNKRFVIQIIPKISRPENKNPNK